MNAPLNTHSTSTASRGILWGFHVAIILGMLSLVWPLWEGEPGIGDPCRTSHIPGSHLLWGALPFLIVLILSSSRISPGERKPALSFVSFWSIVLTLWVTPTGITLSSSVSPLYLPLFWLAQFLVITAAVLVYRSLPATLEKSSSSAWGIGWGVLYIVFLIVIIPNTKKPKGWYGEVASISDLRRIVNCAHEIASSHPEKLFPATLARLAAEPEKCIDPTLATGEKNGYRFEYLSSSDRAQPDHPAFVVTATAFQRSSGCRNYFSDETSVIRFTDEDRAATKDDPPLP